MFAPAALAQQTPDLYDCADFDTQEQAQAVYEAIYAQELNDPNGLDDDNDGIACENLTSGGGQYQYQQQVAQAAPAQAAPAQTALPTTGGVPLLPTGALLLSAGLLGVAAVRRIR